MALGGGAMGGWGRDDFHLLTCHRSHLNRVLTCPYCGLIILVGAPVTVMRRGIHAQKPLHASNTSPCAKSWYEANPLGAHALPEIIYQEPAAELKHFLQQYASGEILDAVLDMTAGGGKSNGIMYVMKLAREQIASGVLAKDDAMVICFNVEAKEELLRRGLVSSEIANFHSIMDHVYKVNFVNSCSSNVVVGEIISMFRKMVSVKLCDVCLWMCYP